MTTTPPEAPAGPPPAGEGPRVTRDELKQLGRIRRTVGPDRKIAGVAGGLARHLDIDPVILRVAFVVLVFFGGAGLIAYGACWVLIPEDYSLRRPLGLDERNRGIALIGAGILAGIVMLSGTLGNDWFPWPIAIIGVIVFLVLGLVDRDKPPRPTAPPVPHVPDPATGTFAPAVPGTFTPAASGTYAPAAASAPPAYAPPLPTDAAPPPTYVAPPPLPAYAAPAPRNPRRRGPILFWFTMALAALGIGVLGIIDLAGVDVAPSAYPAVIVGVCGLMLLVGAWYGRAGGLIFVGLVASLALLGTTVAQRVDGHDISRAPATAATTPSHLHTDAGEIDLNLTEVQDVANLDGREIDLSADAGRIVVVVPDGLTVHVDANIDGPGHFALFGGDEGVINQRRTTTHLGGVGAPELFVNADVSVGEIKIYEEGQP
jgi:phage shock protein PspC (stress-responsive transcriptional regulator)